MPEATLEKTPTMPTMPYYDVDGITIYNADCRKILPFLGKFDLLLTDPPYGIQDKWVGGDGHGWGKARAESKLREEWDVEQPSIETMRAVISTGKAAIVWGGNYFVLPPSRCWLVWNKPERNFSLAEAELAWTNADNVVRVFDCHRSDAGRRHPTQKPLALMRWCLSHSWTKNAETVLDPFMGSGTTLVAAKLEGRRAVGIEIDESYCEIAAKRLAQGVLPGFGHE